SVAEELAISGTISMRPPTLITTTIRIDIKLMFFSTLSWFMLRASRRLYQRNRPGLDLSHRHPHVERQYEHSGKEDDTTQQAEAVVGIGELDGLDERVGQRAVIVQRTPHQALRYPGDPHGDGVQDHADGRRPEMHVNEARGVHGFLAEQPR